MRKQVIVLIALCTALNLGLGNVVFMLKLPIYLDMVGTILCAMILWNERHVGFAAASIAGILSFLLGGIVNPYLPWFSGTAIAVSAFTAYVTSRHAEYFRNSSFGTPGFWVRLIGFGLITGVVSAVVSAPVVVYLFGGVTASGSVVLVAFFLKVGKQLMEAALLSGLSTDTIDKTIELVLAVLLFRATPMSFLKRFQSGKQ